ncbi:unnamed protein product, partial [Brenthis ino]
MESRRECERSGGRAVKLRHGPHCTYNTPEMEQTDTRRNERSSDADRFTHTTKASVGVRLIAAQQAAARAHSLHPLSLHTPLDGGTVYWSSFCMPGLDCTSGNETARVINANGEPAEPD